MTTSRMFYEETQVKLADVPDNVLRSYIDTRDPMVKTGGHGIQGIGGNLIEQGQGGLDILADQQVAYHELFKRRVRTQTHNKRNLDSQSRL